MIFLSIFLFSYLVFGIVTLWQWFYKRWNIARYEPGDILYYRVMDGTIYFVVILHRKGNIHRAWQHDRHGGYSWLASMRYYKVNDCWKLATPEVIREINGY